MGQQKTQRMSYTKLEAHENVLDESFSPTSTTEQSSARSRVEAMISKRTTVDLEGAVTGQPSASSVSEAPFSPRPLETVRDSAPPRAQEGDQLREQCTLFRAVCDALEPTEDCSTNELLQELRTVNRVFNVDDSCHITIPSHHHEIHVTIA